MKWLYDFLPVLVFFIIYKAYGFYAATIAAIILSVLQVLGLWIWQRKLDRMQLLSLVLIVVLGGFTLLFHDPRFLQWKVSVLNWIFALIFLGSHFIGKSCLIERLLSKEIALPRPVFATLNVMWGLYFIVMGVANLYVMMNFSLDAWVNFKLFGWLGLTIVFLILQSIYLAFHIKQHIKKHGPIKR